MKRLSQRAVWSGVASVVLATIGFAAFRFVFPVEREPADGIWSRFQTARLRGDTAEMSSLVPRIDFNQELSAEELERLATELLDGGYVTSADLVLTRALAAHPKAAAFHRRLGALKHHIGQRAQAREHMLHLLSYGGMDLLLLPLMGNAALRLPDEDRAMNRGRDEQHDDSLLFLGLADRALSQHKLAECAAYVRRALELSPELPEAHLCSAELAYQQGEMPSLQRQLQNMPEAARELVQYWVLCGHVWHQQDDVRSAARCYWEAFRRDPLHYDAVSGLGHSLREIGRVDDATALLERARLIAAYADLCRRVHTAHDAVEQLLQMTEEAAVRVGCYREAFGWCQMAKVVAPTEEWPRERMAKLRAKLKPPIERSHPEDDLRGRFDLSAEPLPVFRSQQTSVELSDAVPSFHFENMAKAAGIRFVFEDGADPSNDETDLIEFTGGGVAIVDYDLDGWPDLFFPQGGAVPAIDPNDVPSIKRPSDTLYRNLQGTAAEDVTNFVGLEDNEYGQGASVGDFNADGWPDLYVANAGRNVLYQNNGDGTLSPLADPAFLAAASWTTSCALVDLNRDGLPDLYDCNYVSLKDARTRMCRSGDASVPCQKGSHPVAAQDQILLNQGDGTFDNVTEATGIVRPDGLALGLIAADWDDNGALDLFVANDAKPNFLFMNQSLSPLNYSEEAVLRGVALSATGRAQACMGIAADDFTGHGRVDLFVTNFYADYNTFYRSLPDGLFRDETSERGLREVSYFYLGFGTQALDANLDGSPDIVLTNGDVVDFTTVNPQRKYRQPAQFLWNLGGGRFRDVPRSQLGDYFQSEHLGRGLAVLDFDRDGREDFAVSHIGSTAALVMNRTSATGHWIGLRLVGVRSERDAIGAKITVSTSGRKWHKQLLGGNGYMASNQRRIVVGLGERQAAEFVLITWPSGYRERFAVSEVDREYVLIEGTGRATTGAQR